MPARPQSRRASTEPACRSSDLSLCHWKSKAREEKEKAREKKKPAWLVLTDWVRVMMVRNTMEKIFATSSRPFCAPPCPGLVRAVQNNTSDDLPQPFGAFAAGQPAHLHVCTPSVSSGAHPACRTANLHLNYPYFYSTRPSSFFLAPLFVCAWCCSTHKFMLPSASQHSLEWTCGSGCVIGWSQIN